MSKFNIDTLKLMTKPAVIRNIGLIAPLMVAVACGSTFTAASKAKEALTLRSVPVETVALVHQDASDADIAQVAKRLSPLVPALQVEASGTVLRVTGKEGDYPVWLYALATIPSLDGRLVWTTKSLCVGSCSGKAYVAEFSAYRPVLQRSSGG